MKEFLTAYYSLIVHSVEFLSAIVGLCFYKKYKTTEVRYFIWFLWYLSICDLIGGYVYRIGDFKFLFFLKGTRFTWNYWWYNLFWEIGAIAFFSFYHTKVLKTKVYRAIVKYSGIVFFIFSIIYMMVSLDNFFTGYFPLVRILGAVVVFLCSMLFFIEILKSDKILTFYKSLNFYISAVIFIWWLIITPLVFYDIYNYNRDLNYKLLKWQIYFFAIIFMYLTYTFALIWCKPEND